MEFSYVNYSFMVFMEYLQNGSDPIEETENKILK
jgi:hypothetical protein